MSEPAMRAERIQRLRNVLRDHGLAEEDGAEVESAIITEHGDGSATVVEVTEQGVTEYEAGFTPLTIQGDDRD